jgi:hypothetical protein
VADTDKFIRCKDCGEEFVFTIVEQKYYGSMGFCDPKRCKPCRELRKREMFDTVSRLGAI